MGYVLTPDVDRKMDELGYYPSSMVATCNATASCRGFGSNGYLKSVGTANTIKPGACWYSKVTGKLTFACC